MFPSASSFLPRFHDDDVDDVGTLDPPPDDPPTPLPHLPPTPASSHHDSSPSTTSSSVDSSSPTSPSSSSSTSTHHSDHGAAPTSPPHDAQQLGPRRSTRANRGQPPPRLNDYVTYGVDAFVVPTRYKQAKGDPLWDAAMQTEIDAVHANKTWTVVDRPPPEVPVIGSRWLYAIKMTPEGTIERHKARIVAQGFSQEQGVAFDEKFAPVAKMATVRTLLAVASMRQWPLFQLDVKNAFLHGNLKEVVYLEKPLGYNVGLPGQVFLLHKSLYGLKQAPWAWFEKFQSTVLQLGLHQSLNDPSLFVKSSSAGYVVLLLYVDDMVVTGDDIEGIDHLKKGLQSAFHLKDLGELSYFLGLEITRDRHGIMLSQRKYIGDLLSEHHFEDCLPVSIPMELNLKLSRESGDLLSDATSYRSLVDSLIYLAATRPDISYPVQLISHFMAAPRRDHLAAAHRILRYLRGTQDVSMFFPSTGSPVLRAFSDPDFAGCIDTRRSTTGWCVQFGEAFVSWRCKKQDKVSNSSTEAEYRPLSDVCSEVIWIRRLLGDFGVTCTIPLELFVTWCVRALFGFTMFVPKTRLLTSSPSRLRLVVIGISQAN
ncbi:unnamed protein product [Linum trigynum]|uniref:Reverse transcriptase Ty1/copia-type domain-containing protein n=1 Tax=Linum trigynum TaxID=586398 RepID=A0AAV2CAZ2_9ROSI